jgi:hypothetical protein
LLRERIYVDPPKHDLGWPWQALIALLTFLAVFAAAYSFVRSFA